jgi:hypothetical protein
MPLRCVRRLFGLEAMNKPLGEQKLRGQSELAQTRKGATLFLLHQGSFAKAHIMCIRS